MNGEGENRRGEEKEREARAYFREVLHRVLYPKAHGNGIKKKKLAGQPCCSVTNLHTVVGRRRSSLEPPHPFPVSQVETITVKVLITGLQMLSFMSVNPRVKNAYALRSNSTCHGLCHQRGLTYGLGKIQARAQATSAANCHPLARSCQLITTLQTTMIQTGLESRGSTSVTLTRRESL